MLSSQGRIHRKSLTPPNEFELRIGDAQELRLNCCVRRLHESLVRDTLLWAGSFMKRSNTVHDRKRQALLLTKTHRSMNACSNWEAWNWLIPWCQRTYMWTVRLSLVWFQSCDQAAGASCFCKRRSRMFLKVSGQSTPPHLMLRVFLAPPSDILSQGFTKYFLLCEGQKRKSMIPGKRDVMGERERERYRKREMERWREIRSILYRQEDGTQNKINMTTWSPCC